MINRRTFFGGLAAAIAAPVVASATSLMPLRGVKLFMPQLRLVSERAGIDIVCPDEVLTGLDGPMPPDLSAVFTKMALRAPCIDRTYVPDIRFETTDRIRQHVQIQMIRNRNVLIEVVNPIATRGIPSAFWGVPIEVAA